MAAMRGEAVRRKGFIRWQVGSSLPNVQILTRTTAVGYYDRDIVTLLESVPNTKARSGLPRERYWIVRANRVIFATGAIEQPLVFCNNDRPGILLAGAAHGISSICRRVRSPCGRRDQQ